MTHGAMDKTTKPQYWMMSNGHLQASTAPPHPSNERISGSNWIGDFVSQTAILNGMPERQTSGQQL